MSDARTEIFRRCREATKDIPTDETPDHVCILRDYLRHDAMTTEERIALFVERVSEYRATVRRIGRADLPGAIASSCAARGVRNLIVPADIPGDWLPSGVSALHDHSLSNESLNASDGVLTGCALGVAPTGTIILDHGENQGRRAITLLPDYHLCVIREDQIVGTVPEAISALSDSATELRRPLTWISGPSATSDIELNRVEGVHGPRTLEVLVVAKEPPGRETGEI